MIIADPLGDLESARRLSPPGAQILGATSLEPATRHHLLHALARHPRLLAIAGHVRPGTSVDPAAAALLLDSDIGATDPVTVGRTRRTRGPTLVPRTRLRRIRRHHRSGMDRRTHRSCLGRCNRDRHQHRPRHRRQRDSISGQGTAPARRSRWAAPRPAQLATSLIHTASARRLPIGRPQPRWATYVATRSARSGDRIPLPSPGAGTLQIGPALGISAIGHSRPPALACMACPAGDAAVSARQRPARGSGIPGVRPASGLSAPRTRGRYGERRDNRRSAPEYTSRCTRLRSTRRGRPPTSWPPSSAG